MHACYPLAKILWLRRSRPELLARTKYIGSIKDYLFHTFTGEFLIDRSTASTTALYNARELAWDQEILTFIGITEDMLPPVISTTESRPLTAEAAERMHLPAGLPVVIGATDGVLVNVGIGAVSAGQLSATIGTSGAVRMLVGEPRVDEKMRTWCYNLVDDLWVAGGAINNGGMILRWMRDKICHFSEARMEGLDVDAYDLMTMKASKIPAGSDGLILLPFFTGERAPYWNSDLRGLFFGLSLNHSRSHMIRAVMEGICYGMRNVFEALQEFGTVRDIRASGSFTKSPLRIRRISCTRRRSTRPIPQIQRPMRSSRISVIVSITICSESLQRLQSTRLEFEIERIMEENHGRENNWTDGHRRLWHGGHGQQSCAEHGGSWL